MNRLGANRYAPRMTQASFTDADALAVGKALLAFLGEGKTVAASLRGDTIVLSKVTIFSVIRAAEFTTVRLPSRSSGGG
jgi:hypothetical protein